QIPATVPVSPVFEVEVMKAMAQLEERKTVTLYIVPQNSLHVFPHALQKIPSSLALPPLFAGYKGSLPLSGPITTSPGHIPAVEVPLEKPLVLGVAQQDVLAPAGFTVLLQGPQGNPLSYPLVTGALLAPVPVGTIISEDTPVVLTTLYAVPNLPSLPSAVQVLAQFSPSKGHGPGGPQLIPASPVRPVNAIAIRPAPIGQIQVSSTPSSVYPISPVGPQVSFGQYPIREQVPVYPSKHPRPPTVVQVPFTQSTPRPVTEIPISPQAPFSQRPFPNSKESPYLTQLREDSLRRQIQDLQQQLNDIQASRYE
ncbi:unnamed protein product, partial [Allacma fusca]